MTDIAFHTGIANPLDYACRLLRKAYRSGARVAVHGEPALLDRLDQALWTFEPVEERRFGVHRDARTRPIRLAQQPARVIQRIRDAGVEGDLGQGAAPVTSRG